MFFVLIDQSNFSPFFQKGGCCAAERGSMRPALNLPGHGRVFLGFAMVVHNALFYHSSCCKGAGVNDLLVVPNGGAAGFGQCTGHARHVGAMDFINTGWRAVPHVTPQSNLTLVTSAGKRLVLSSSTWQGSTSLSEVDVLEVRMRCHPLTRGGAGCHHGRKCCSSSQSLGEPWNEANELRHCIPKPLPNGAGASSGPRFAACLRYV